MTNRRKFLQLIGVGAASAPAAAKALTEEQIMGQAGIRRYGTYATSDGVSEAAADDVGLSIVEAHGGGTNRTHQSIPCRG